MNKKNKTLIHNIHPTVKVFVLIFFFVLIFLSSSLFINIILFLVIITIWFVAKISWRTTFNLFISAIAMFLVLLIVNYITVKSPGLAIFNINDIKLSYTNQDYYVPIANNPDIVNSAAFNDSAAKYFYCYIGQSVAIEWPTTLPKMQYFNINYTEVIKEVKNLIKTDGGVYAGYTYTMKQITNGDKGLGYLVLFYKTQFWTFAFQNLYFSLNVTFKIILSICTMTILMSTTTHSQLTFAIYHLLYPFKFIGLPINEWSMIISLSLRFVPTLLSESKSILNAQASRGSDITNGSLKDKAKALVSLIVPMFVISFIKSNDLAYAMEARNYDPKSKRTSYLHFSIHMFDVIFLILIFFVFGLIILFLSNNLYFFVFATPDLLLHYA